MTVVVGEVDQRAGELQVREGPVQERRHLTPGHDLVGTEAVVGGRVAPAGHPRGRQPLDVRLEHRGVVVGEVRGAACREVGQGPVQEGRHLAPGHGCVGTEEGVGRRVAALGDPRCRQPVDVAGEDVAPGVTEAGTRARDRIGNRLRVGPDGDRDLLSVDGADTDLHPGHGGSRAGADDVG